MYTLEYRHEKYLHAILGLLASNHYMTTGLSPLRFAHARKDLSDLLLLLIHSACLPATHYYF